MRLLIAGCGDLGLRVANRILENPDDAVWGLRRHTSTLAGPERMQWVQADLTKPESLCTIPANPTHVLFAAAPDARSEPAYRDLYLHGLQRLLKAVGTPALERVVFISSTAVHGDHGDTWVDEDTPVAPTGFNGRVLCEAEAFLMQQASTSGTALTTISLRLSGIYGPGRTYLVDRLRQGLASAPPDGAHWANRIHIEDAARAVVHTLRLPRPKSVYLVTDDTPLPMRTLYEALAKIAGGPVPPLGPAPAGIGSKRLRNARLRESGFEMLWPDSRSGHAALIAGTTAVDARPQLSG